jgi:hypothetical protein
MKGNWTTKTFLVLWFNDGIMKNGKTRHIWRQMNMIVKLCDWRHNNRRICVHHRDSSLEYSFLTYVEENTSFIQIWNPGFPVTSKVSLWVSLIDFFLPKTQSWTSLRLNCLRHKKADWLGSLEILIFLSISSGFFLCKKS